jgi:hypothetical protein
VVSVGGVSSVGHSGDCHDEECGLEALGHDASSHRVGPDSADPAHTLHCVLCHWTRSIRLSPGLGHSLASPIAGDVLIQIESPGVIFRVDAAQPPLRSPPSSRFTS